MRILIATGGTGGHIFPALQTAKALKAQGHSVVFAGSLDMAADRIHSEGFDVNLIKAQGLHKSPLGILQFSWVMWGAVAKSIKIIKMIHPDKVIGFGGYGSFPIIFAAKILKIPSMIHEQNVVPGKANKLMSKLVNKIAISFQESRRVFPESKVIWTGCPCHGAQSAKTREEILTSLGLVSNLKVVALLGGSQGSHKLNEVFCDLVLTYGKELGIQAIHMTGKKDFDHYQQRYAQSSVPVKVMAFIHNIEDVYSICDAVIARAGAATVTEIGLRGIPAIFIPYPFAENHQKYNAEVLTKTNAALLLEQKNLTIDSLRKALENVCTGEYTKSQIQQRTHGLFAADAANQLALAIIND